MKEHGFTLLELTIATLIAGLIAAVALPDLRSTDPGKVDLAAAEIARILRHTRTEALRTGTPHGVRITSTTRTFDAFRLDTLTSPPTPIYDIRDPLSKALFSVRLADLSATATSRIDNLTVTWSASCNATTLLSFDGAGVPRCTDPMSSRLASGAVSIALGSYTRRVRIGPYTGRVSIE